MRVRALPLDVRREASAWIVEAIRRSDEWAGANIVALFAPLSSEPNIEPLLEMGGARLFCFPRALPEGQLHFHAVREPGQLIPVSGALREPVAEAYEIPVEEIDLLVVPGLAFTREGLRLGRGGGYYDRFLAQPLLRAKKMAACFQTQLVEELPILDHDEKVDAIVTEFGMFHTAGSPA